MININLSGVFFCMKYQIAAMLKNGGGSIVNMACILGDMGFATSLVHTAAKHGVLGLTQAAQEYSALGVWVAAKSGRTRGVVFVRAGDLCGDLLLSGG